MAFAANPLSVSVPDEAFESWLRDSGYLELIDQHSSSTAATTVNFTSTSDTAAEAATNDLDHASPTGGFFFDSLFPAISVLLSVLSTNPFSKLSAADFSAPTPSWTGAFIGDCGSYSFPSGSHQARIRVTENVKRYARNYATLFIVFFACSLYQMPLALVGLISCLAVWDMFKFSNERWEWDRYPVLRQVLVRAAQCATAVVLIILNVQKALLCAIAVSYAVTILHATFRKLTLASRQPPKKR
ncbi:unnamed protein product [Linum tenue]|uniref:PRA1 family protein n=1 Tax=Linum tenue TaxID=586396 RepID=A0AAV0JG15_9ROSI|nr:unnamed protein product [Linum tenue]